MAAFMPDSVTLSASVVKVGGTVKVSWAGGTANNGTPVSTLAGFRISYCDSANNSTWGSWSTSVSYAKTSSGGSMDFDVNLTPGSYRKFRVQTYSNDGYSSSWRESTASVRTNIPPATPTTFTALPTTYSSGTITLTWSGAKAGASSIKNYVLQISASADGTAWGEYSALTTVTTTATSGNYAYTPASMAAFSRYRICVTDTLNDVSDYAESDIVRFGAPPPTPVITAPKNAATTYNTKPILLITTEESENESWQTVYVRDAFGELLNSVDNPDNFIIGSKVGNMRNIVFRHNEIAPGNASVTVYAENEIGTSGSVARTFTVAASPFVPIIPNETTVKAAHILTLRTAVNSVRDYYGLSAVTWQEKLIPGKTQIKNWTYHIMEIRKAVDQIIQTINQFDSVTADMEWLPIEPGRPRAAAMEQLHDLILTL